MPTMTAPPLPPTNPPPSIPPDPACPTEYIGSALGTVAEGSSYGLPAGRTASCGFGNAEVSFEWQSPSAGSYVFDTVGSDFDTVLAVRASGCAGPEIACNDDTYGVASAVRMYLAEGESVILSLTDLSGVGGRFALNISSTSSDECLVADIGSAMGDVVLDGSLGTAGPGLTNQCGGAGLASVVAWTAPYAGQFLFRTRNSGFDPVLDVRFSCLGTAFECNDDYEGLESGVSLWLEERARILVVVTALDLAPPGASFGLQIYDDL
jgi:hypothetical protein